MMAMVTIWNTSMVKLRGMLTVEIAVKRQKAPRHSIAGVVLTVTKMAGLTQQARGLQAPEAVAMLGRWTQRNGMISMVMGAGITLVVQPPTFVQTKQAPQLAPLPVATDGVVLTPMVMVGLILAMLSFMSLHNGAIQMVMATVTVKMVTKAMLVPKFVVRPCSIDSAAATQTVTVGQTQPLRGKLTLPVQPMLSQQKLSSGATLMATAMEMSRLVPSETIALSKPAPRSETSRVVLIRTMMGGRMTTASLLLPLRSLAKIPKHLGSLTLSSV
jgi:hypothetical protein